MTSLWGQVAGQFHGHGKKWGSCFPSPEFSYCENIFLIFSMHSSLGCQKQYLISLNIIYLGLCQIKVMTENEEPQYEELGENTSSYKPLPANSFRGGYWLQIIFIPFLTSVWSLREMLCGAHRWFFTWDVPNSGGVVQQTKIPKWSSKQATTCPSFNWEPHDQGLLFVRFSSITDFCAQHSPATQAGLK